MEITRKDIASYRFIEPLIEKNKRKLDQYKKREPTCASGKVYGSEHDYPYTQRGFTVSGIDPTEYARWREWDNKCEELEAKVENDIKKMQELRTAIDELIADINDIMDKTIFEYTREGKSQQWIANKIHLDQSGVSRRISKYVKDA